MKKFALPVNEWGVYGDLPDDIPPDVRYEADFVIGVVRNEAGEDEEYIIEPIFLDVVENLQTDGKKAFTTHTSITQVPPVVFKYNNILIMHNHSVQDYMIGVKETLEDIPTEILMKSLVDQRVMRYERKKGDGMKALESLVRSKSGINYNSELINYMMQQMVYEANEDEVGIRKMFDSMDQKDIIRFLGAVKAYSMIEETDNKELAKLLNSFKIEEIEAAVNREITDRYFLGFI